jgi:hypothetical protein
MRLEENDCSSPSPAAHALACTSVMAPALELESPVKRFLADTRGVSAAEFERRWQDLVLMVHRLL